MLTDEIVAGFDARFSRLRATPANRQAMVGAFTEAEVDEYIAAKSQLRIDFSYPYRDLLVCFPRDWWNAAIVKVLQQHSAHGLTRQEYSNGAGQFARAAFDIAPDLFESAPELVVRWQIDPRRAYVWLRERETRARERLQNTVQQSDMEWRWRAAAYLLLLDPTAAPFVVRVLESLEPQQQKTATWKLTQEGWEYRERRLRRLWPEKAFHLVFEAGYLQDRVTENATWKPTTVQPGVHAFGGSINDLHHVLTLDPVPVELGICIPRLVLGIDLDFALEDGSEQYFYHSADGTLISAHNPPPYLPLEQPPFAQTRIRLAEVASAYWVQDWGASNGQENLFRLGGPPVFVQSPSYPRCITCTSKMMHAVARFRHQIEQRGTQWPF